MKLTDEQVSDLRSKHGWAKETIRAIEAEVLRLNGGGGEAVAWLYTLLGHSGEIANMEASTINWDERYQPFGRPGIDFHEDGVVRKEPLYAAPQPQQAAPVARVAEVHMSRYTIEWTNGPLPEGTELFANSAQAAPGAVLEGKLWLWKNFVNGNPEYWAFDNPYPVHMDCGDPQTLGEPCGYAIFKPSRNGRPDVSEGKVLAAIARSGAPKPQVE